MYVAVTVALCALVTVPAVAENVLLLAPESMVALAGTVTAALSLESATTAFAVAALFRLTVHVDVAPPVIVDGAQLTELTCAGALAVTVVETETLLADA